MSNRFRDQPDTPLGRTVYWIEFVLRHNGASHLRLASQDLAPYQRYLLDVYLLLSFALFLSVSVPVFVVRRVCYRRKSGRVGQQSNKEKKKN